MSKFIEVHVNGKRRLINKDWIEEIIEEPAFCKTMCAGATIYFAFCCPNSTDQDYIKPDESYIELQSLIQKV